MKNVQGLWLPDGETHMIDVITGPKARVVEGVVSYQYRKFERAMQFVPPERRRRCIDIGAHVGTWSMHFVKLFRWVEAFEPVAEHAAIYPHNVKEDNYLLHPVAIGEKPGRVGMKQSSWSTGSAHVWGDGDVEMRTLDSYDFTEVDFIKIDVEGLELQVCKGAALTIAKNRPIMVVEQKGREVKTYGEAQRDQAVAWLEKHLGMRRLDCISGDWMMGW